MNEMFSISIGEMVIDMYLNNYSVDINGRYASDINFTSISGKTMNKYLGDSRELSVNFEPMETSQINELFQKIKSYRNNIPITYKDPQKGQITKHFRCDNLPVATYFISDDGREFWTIPTVVFAETEESASEDDIDPDGSIRWLYSISLGGEIYNDDEISNDLSVSVSSGSSGYAIGQCCTSTISGTLLYHQNSEEIKRNAQIILTWNKQQKVAGEWILIENKSYMWFINSFTLENNILAHFSANDVMAYVDNVYPMLPGATVSEHIDSAANTITEIIKTTVEIEKTSHSAQKSIYNASGWDIRTLLGYAAVYGAVNYSALFEYSGDSNIRIGVIDETTPSFPLSTDNYSPLTIGLHGTTIMQIRVSQTDDNDPVLDDGETYDDYGIYYLADIKNKSNVMQVTCPFVESDIRATGDLYLKIGQSYGTEFSCDSAKIDGLISPYTKIIFSGYSGEDTFYLSNASYKFTLIGIFASISGTTKSLSDYEYIGQTETQLKTKVALQRGYQGGYISLEDGIYWDDNAVMENINDG